MIPGNQSENDHVSFFSELTLLLVKELHQESGNKQYMVQNDKNAYVIFMAVIDL